MVTLLILLHDKMILATLKNFIIIRATGRSTHRQKVLVMRGYFKKLRSEKENSSGRRGKGEIEWGKLSYIKEA